MADDQELRKRRVILALKAGYKPWAYKAEVIRLPMALTPQCIICDRVFVSIRRDARYCSNACRQKAHRQRHK